ncbi:MAG: serine--tRNA ligase [Chloroflexi bacterium B3_Chlor]|nr:MAG: serine--tRNA ligase [Chloroflexi bacterium B3_Chlor]
MLDLKFIREHPDEVREALAKLNETAPIDEILALDTQRRELLAEAEALKHRRNVVSKEIGRMKEKDQALIAEMREVGDRIKELDGKLAQVEEELDQLLLLVPNLPDPSVPVGRDESDNVVLRTVGESRQFDFEPLAHWDLGPMLDIIDFERGVKVSGTRFYVLKGLGARLQRAAITWMMDVHVKEHGYTEVYPPFLVLSKCLVGTGNLPKFADNLYRYEPDDLWMIPTAEVPVTNLYRDEILAPGSLPIKHVSYTACFRREHMSAGRDTRGIKRGHQFDKVELVRLVEPDASAEHLEELVRDAARVAELLEISYRVVEMCTGDLAFSAMKKYDVEMWAPGVEEWLEVSSCSNFGDFQARRANIRYRAEQGAKPRFVHTLNGSGLGLPRVMIAIMENYQQPDGRIVIPEVLRPYMDDLEVIPSMS